MLFFLVISKRRCMSPPPGLTIQGESNKVCNPKKVIYVLKHYPSMVWHDQWSFVIGSKRGTTYNILFVRQGKGITALILYVDDIIMTRNCPSSVTALKYCLSKDFQIKDLGYVKYLWQLKLQDLTRDCRLWKEIFSRSFGEERDKGLSGSKLAYPPYWKKSSVSYCKSKR